MWINDLLSDNTVDQVNADYTHCNDCTLFLAIANIYVVNKPLKPRVGCHVVNESVITWYVKRRFIKQVHALAFIFGAFVGCRVPG
jgi:hypothetical protein